MSWLGGERRTRLPCEASMGGVILEHISLQPEKHKKTP